MMANEDEGARPRAEGGGAARALPARGREAQGSGAAGTVVLGTDGRIFQANAVARRIFTARDGLVLVDGCLRAEAPEADRALRVLIKRVTALGPGDGAGSPEGILVLRPSGKRPFVLVPEAAADGRADAVRLLLLDPERLPPMPMDLIQTLYGLTPREADIAASLAAGHSLAACARVIGVAVSTARRHLNAVFQKTATRRQAELVRFLVLHAVYLSEL